jgi:ATP-dependent Clp protease ATP-binding subunit ClpB
MQADRFTVKSQEAVAAAQELARSRQNPEIASSHLLLALLDQAESMAVAVLQRVGSDPAAVRAGANEAIAKLPTVSGGEEPRMSSNLARVVRDAEKAMAKFGDSYITVGHLLLALAEDGSGVSDLSSNARSKPSRAQRKSTRRTPRTTRRRWRNSAATSPPRPRAASSTR